MMRLIKLISLLCLCLLLGCSSEDEIDTSEPPGKNHVLKEKMNTINEAKKVEGIILDSAEATRKTIDNQTE